MHFTVWDRISFRLGVAIVAVTIAVFGGMAVFVTSDVDNLFQGQRTEDARRTAAIIAGDLSVRMRSGEHDVWLSVREDIREIADAAGASDILLIGRSSGIIRASTNTPLIGKTLDLANSTECPGCSGYTLEELPKSSIVASLGGPNKLRVVSAIPATSRCSGCHDSEQQLLGIVTVDFDMSPINAASRTRTYRVGAIGAIAGALLLIIAAAFFRRLVLQPIQDLETAADALAAGALSARTHPVGQSELSQLGHHFNRMAQKIEEQVQNLAANNLELDLLYTLVTEVSRDLEISEMAATVVKVLNQKLQPTFISFVVQTAEDRWACASSSTPDVVRGHGKVMEAVKSTSAVGIILGENFEYELIEAACSGGVPKIVHNESTAQFAVPVRVGDELLGLLTCDTGRLTKNIDKELFLHLCAHLTLAAESSRNYVGAVTDSLTGLRNKRYGFARLDELLSTAQRYSENVSVLMLDIDHFKNINDTFGHLSGDEVLKEVGRRIIRSTRRSDVAIRFGGEEFLVILPNTAVGDIAMIAEKVREDIGKYPIIVSSAESQMISITVSIGAASFGDYARTAAALVSAADRALYEAKQGGRNQVRVGQMRHSGSPVPAMQA